MEILKTKVVGYDESVEAIIVEEIFFRADQEKPHRVTKIGCSRRSFDNVYRFGTEINVYLWNDIIPKIYYEEKENSSILDESKTDIQIILEHIDNQPKSFFIVFGSKLNEDFKNIKLINSLVIPNNGDIINYNKTKWLIQNKMIDYSQVENHDLNSDERGRENIYVFVVKA